MGAKLASEAFISSYGYMNNVDATIFRFPNVMGPFLTHGVAFGFIGKLRQNNEPPRPKEGVLFMGNLLWIQEDPNPRLFTPYLIFPHPRP